MSHEPTWSFGRTPGTFLAATSVVSGSPVLGPLPPKRQEAAPSHCDNYKCTPISKSSPKGVEKGWSLNRDALLILGSDSFYPTTIAKQPPPPPPPSKGPRMHAWFTLFNPELPPQHRLRLPCRALTCVHWEQGSQQAQRGSWVPDSIPHYEGSGVGFS